ncbi:MAG: hypothetical protein CSA15_02225, partial [Candidatus Delongbacteria bacterium]
LGRKVTAGTIYYYLKKAKLTNNKHFEFPSLENFEEYEKQEEEVLLEEYQKFAKNKEHPNYYEIIYSFFRIFRDKGLFSKAIEVGKKILKRKERYLEKLKSKISFIEGEIYYHLGDCFKFNNQKEEAEKSYHKAYETFEKTSNNGFTLEFIKGACRSLELKGKHHELTINELKNQLTTTSNPKIKVQILVTLGVSNSRVKKYQKGIESFKKSLKFEKEKDDEYGKVCLNIAMCYNGLREYTNATEYLEKAEKYTKENNYQKAKIELVRGLSYLNIAGEHRKSEKSFLRARLLFRQIADERNYLLSTCHLARFYHKYHNLKKLAKVKPVIESYLKSPEHQKMSQKYLKIIE